MKGACVNCIHYESGGQHGGHFCKHIEYVDPVTGEAITPCREIRGVPTIISYFTGGCGRGGRFFKEKVKGENND